MVRLLLNLPSLCPSERPIFQSHNGAIAAHLRPKSCLFAGQLSIPQWCDCCNCPRTSIGSTKELSIPQWCDCCFFCYSHLPKPRYFQSHNGAIAALPQSVPRERPASFQSHNGAIAAAIVAVYWALARTFNPTMVRLLQPSVPALLTPPA